MKLKPVKLPQKVSAGRSLLIIHLHRCLSI
jgi:hypothetical protein